MFVHGYILLYVSIQFVPPHGNRFVMSTLPILSVVIFNQNIQSYTFLCNSTIVCCNFHCINILAGRRSDYHMRALYISNDQKHVFEPLMRRCLKERPIARGTFEDVIEDIQILLRMYAKDRQAETLEGKMVRLVFSSFVQLSAWYICNIQYICMCSLCREPLMN